MLIIILLILFSEFWGVGGHILFKKVIDMHEAPSLRDLGSYLKFTGTVLKSFLIWIGFAMVFISIIIWLTALAQTALSIAFPINSMTYVVTLIFARIFLGEHIDRMKLIGTLLVVAGVILVAMS